MINAARAKGGTCGTTAFAASGPLTLAPELRGVARCHAEHMTQNMYLRARRQEKQPDGTIKEVPLTTLATTAGYTWVRMGINVGGLADAQSQFNQWRNSPNSCVYLLDPDFTEVGIGYTLQGTTARFTQIVARP